MTDWTILAAIFGEYVFQVLLITLLLCCSAFFSGSETAFFSISRQTIRRFSASTTRLERLVSRILNNPNRFLTALLFGNMAVNILYFAVSSTLLINIAQNYGNLAGTACGIICFFLILLFGEMLPKSIAYANTKQFCLFAGPACFFFLKILSPLIKTIDWTVVQPAIRLLTGAPKPAYLSTNQLKALLDSSRQRGLITHDQNQLLSEILNMNLLKVRHVMLPRVQMAICNITMTPTEVRNEMNNLKINRVPVCTSSIDRIIGVVHLRDILLYPDRPLDSIVHKVNFVPEQQTIDSLINFFKQSRTDYAVVVDEYGGVAGQIELEDVIEQLIGPLELDGSTPDLVEQIAPMEYRLHANLAITEWAAAFGVNPTEGRFQTIGGFVTALLKKNPEEGDTVTFGNIRFTVETVRKHRVCSVLLSLDPLTQSEKDERSS